MFKRIVMASVAAVALCATDVRAACAPSDIIGKWNVTMNTNPFWWRSQAPATITAAGKLTGALQAYDKTGIQGWQIVSITPIRVASDCKVTGQFARVWGATEKHTYAFSAFMDEGKNNIGDMGFVWPGYDEAPIGQDIIYITMKRVR